MSENEMLVEEFMSWVDTQFHPTWEVEPFQSEKEEGYRIVAEHAKGVVTIYHLDYTIVEYRVYANDEQPAFYLHFELKDLDHAKDLFLEMKNCMLKLSNKKSQHALLCCSCGLTTSFFTMKLNEATKSMDIDLDFVAVPYEKLYEASRDADIVLLAPQIGYQLKNAQEILEDKKVLVIPAQIFSAYQVFEMIELVKNNLNEEEVEEVQIKENDVVKTLHKENNGSILILSVINMEGRNQIAYRLYDDGDVILENQVIKETYQFKDILDALDLVVGMNPKIEKIALVTPGAIKDGILTYESANIFNLNVMEELKKHFSQEIFLYNVTDMIALGYARKEKIEEDLAFYFVPSGSYAGSIGLVVNQALVGGSLHMGGEQLGSLTNITTFPKNPYTLVQTPEGNVDLAARYFTGLYSFTGIEHIAFYAKMIPNVDDLKEALKGLLPEGYLPELHKVSSVRDYLYEGTLASL